jgi:hypothetical protein
VTHFQLKHQVCFVTTFRIFFADSLLSRRRKDRPGGSAAGGTSAHGPPPALEWHHEGHQAVGRQQLHRITRLGRGAPAWPVRPRVWRRPPVLARQRHWLVPQVGLRRYPRGGQVRDQPLVLCVVRRKLQRTRYILVLYSPLGMTT